MNNNIANLPPNSPPNFIPPYSDALHSMDKNNITQHFQMYIYIWLNPKIGFWLFPTDINELHINGYIWLKTGWTHTTIPRSKIDCIY